MAGDPLTGRTTSTVTPRMGDCDLLRVLAARTCSDIRDGARVDLVVGEEAITDYLLLDLRRHSRRLTYLQKWGRWDEGRRTGADWDWWFVLPDLSEGVGLRIQAKRVDFFTQRFPHFDHRNAGGRQIDRLDTSAAAAGMHALYCLYVASDTVPQEAETACPTYGTVEGPPDWAGSAIELYGCSLAGTPTIRASIDAGILELAHLWWALLPWSCLVCCDHAGGSLLERVDNGARRIGRLPTDEDELGAPLPPSRIRGNLPREVMALVQGEGRTVDVMAPDVSATVVTVAERPS